MRHPTEKEVTALRLLKDFPDGLLGTQIVKESENLIRQGSVYFILDRLNQEGYVDSRPEPPPPGYGGKLRHVFTITALGQDVLKAEEEFTALLALRTTTPMVLP